MSENTEKRKSLLYRYLSDGLLQQLLYWKDERNRLIHVLLKQEFEHDEITTLAMQGKELSDKLKS